MGQLRSEDTPPDPEAAARFAAEFFKRVYNTPGAQLMSEADYLAVEAERARNAAAAAGRTPRPRSPSPVPPPPAEEKTTCLRIEKAPASSAQPSSTPTTEAALSAGESQRLEQMAAADREILDQRRLLRTTPGYKPRT